MKKIPSFRRGFSLIELLLVLGVIAVLLVAAFVIYPQVQSSNRANAESLNFSAMSAKISSLYATSPSNGRFRTLTNAVAMNARIFPDGMREGVTNPANVKSVWGGTVTVAGVPEYDYAQYWVTYEDVPSSDCIKFATGIVNGVEALNVGGLQVKFGVDANEGWVPGEIRPENIAAGCNSAEKVTIIAQNKR